MTIRHRWFTIDNNERLFSDVEALEIQRDHQYAYWILGTARTMLPWIVA